MKSEIPGSNWLSKEVHFDISPELWGVLSGEGGLGGMDCVAEGQRSLAQPLFLPCSRQETLDHISTQPVTYTMTQ